MRIALKGTIAFLALYMLVLAGAALFVEFHLRSVARTMVDETARLLGGEVVKTLRVSAIEQLLADDETTRERLTQIVDDVTHHSNVIVSLAVVDRSGKVVASDRVDPAQQFPIPDAIFSSDKQVFTSELHHQGGDYHLFVPLLNEGNLMGYVRLSLRSRPIARLYASTRRQFLLAACSGLLAVAALGLVWHVHLTRRGQVLAKALEQAMRGEAATEGRPDEFARALGVAHRLGAELSAAKEGHEQASRRLGALLEAMQGGVVLVGRNGELDYANPLACELLSGAEPAVPAAEAWNEVRTRLAERIAGGVRPGDSFDIDLGRGGAARPLRLQWYPLGDDGECLFLVKSRESMAALERELGLAIQMRGLARFYAAFAHDLRAPLNALVMNLELLRQTLGEESADPATGKRQSRYAEVLHDELSRLNRQLNLLLGHVAPPSTEVSEVNLCDLVADLVGLMEPQAKRQRVTLRTEFPDRRLVLTGSPDRLKQAMLNIAINALEAMPDGGDLFIGLAANNGHAEIQVRDTGPGIPPEVMERIYDMHFTTKSGGTGVGLYVARSVVESSGGSIAVESRAGEGTSFQVRLPVRA